LNQEELGKRLKMNINTEKKLIKEVTLSHETERKTFETKMKVGGAMMDSLTYWCIYEFGEKVFILYSGSREVMTVLGLTFVHHTRVCCVHWFEYAVYIGRERFSEGAPQHHSIPSHLLPPSPPPLLGGGNMRG